MTEKLPTKAQMLAACVMGNGSSFASEATVQRSHRFPVVLMVQIENMARMAKMPVSAVINDLLEIGLEATTRELDQDTAKATNRVQKEQYAMLGLSPEGEPMPESTAKPKKTRTKKSSD